MQSKNILQTMEISKMETKWVSKILGNIWETSMENLTPSSIKLFFKK